ncbi:hypothetical protein [Escherichia fergusonii]|uniref:hypothetical protein n=1 Tax=Escherichia fergusonii TaxID=564 RepID=UPI0015F6D206|nr:hypothetical protein [Escherichia fergusonii]EHJ4092143.1 hypothetical protein [Escherichia fergusonii]EHJ4133088.1 hypothetical protein [Escherichia fergusonii]MBA8266782.1 hypothetical protein [Escherichia fergusonii]MBY7516659.1 hypothetical protein [Escherichia fergusonii]MBZ4072696.1 hypothetical protein [Escherichia fergusonii]
MSVNFKEWEYLLDGTDPGWVISNMGTDEEPEYLFINEITGHGLIVDIEDKEYDQLMNGMIERGMKVVKVKY